MPYIYGEIQATSTTAVDEDGNLTISTIYSPPNIKTENSSKIFKSLGSRFIAVGDKDRPWFNTNIKQSIEERDTAYNRWKRFKTNDLPYF